MKNKKIINVICYIITAALAVFYLATLVLGSKRQVSQEYDLYYVDGKLSKWPGEHGLDYNFGDIDIYDISKLEEYKKLLEEEKLYGDPSGRNEQDDADNNEADKDSVESNRDSALDKYFQKMLAAENSNLSDNIDDKADKAGDPDTADTDSSEKSTALKLKILYRYSKGFYSLHTGIYTTNGNEAALYYRFNTNVPSDVVLDVYGASYNTSTKVYANNVYIGTVEAYDNTDVSVMYHKNAYDEKMDNLDAEADAIGKEKQEALRSFEEETTSMITEEINNRRLPALEAMKEEKANMENEIAAEEKRFSDQTLLIANKYAAILGEDLCRQDKLEDLIAIMQEGQADTVSEAIAVYKGQKASR